MTGLKDLGLKIKGIRLRRFLNRNARRRERRAEGRAAWLNPVSHGYRVVESDEARGHGDRVREWLEEAVVVQREQHGQGQGQGSEVWFFGVFDRGGLGDGVIKYVQSHFFDRMPPLSSMEKKGKEIMKRAHQVARSKLQDSGGVDVDQKMGSASAMVINGEKLVMANMGKYRAVVCRDGEAFQIGMKKQQSGGLHWSVRFLTGVFSLHRGETVDSGCIESSKLVVGSERVNSEIEFVILASDGVWEVMQQQEAVNLIKHMENAQAAAECLATEASTRMAKGSISSLVIRFD